MHTMMAHSGLHEKLKTGIWPEYAATVNQIKILWLTCKNTNLPMISSTERYLSMNNTELIFGKLEWN